MKLTYSDIGNLYGMSDNFMSETRCEWETHEEIDRERIEEAICYIMNRIDLLRFEVIRKEEGFAYRELAPHEWQKKTDEEGWDVYGSSQWELRVKGNKFCAMCGHHLADGYSGGLFIMSIISRYFEDSQETNTALERMIRRFYTHREGLPVLQVIKEPPHENISEQSYPVHAIKTQYLTEPGNFLKYSIEVPAEQVRKTAAFFGVKEYVFLSGLLGEAVRQADVCEKNTTIPFSVPVNARMMVPKSILLSNNAVANVDISYPGEDSFRENLHQITKQCEHNITREFVEMQMYQREMLVKRIEDMNLSYGVKRRMYHKIAAPYMENRGVFVLSYNGRLAIPRQVSERLRSISFWAVDTAYPILAEVVEINGIMNIGIMSRLSNHRVEECFVSSMRSLGLAAKGVEAGSYQCRKLEF